jgi:hypothetical protein
MSIQIRITDNASPAIANAVTVLTFRRAAKTAAAALRVQIRSHLLVRQGQPNKQGWPKTNWHKRARDRVDVYEDGTGVGVSIDLPGFASRYTGQPAQILPVNVKTLAIPMHPSAYGKRPREFADLLFIPVNKGRTVGLLARQVGVGASRVFINLYRLVKWVNNKADPTLLPTPQAMADHAFAAIVRRAEQIQ